MKVKASGMRAMLPVMPVVDMTIPDISMPEFAMLLSLMRGIKRC